jgi:hypothetical protein
MGAIVCPGNGCCSLSSYARFMSGYFLQYQVGEIGVGALCIVIIIHR